MLRCEHESKHLRVELTGLLWDNAVPFTVSCRYMDPTTGAICGVWSAVTPTTARDLVGNGADAHGWKQK
jgi:hypothetical protein